MRRLRGVVTSRRAGPIANPRRAAADAAAHAPVAANNDAPRREEEDAGAATPLLSAVAERAARKHELPLHVPGHQRGRALHPRMRHLIEAHDTAAHDLTELSGLDCLAAASMLLAAEADGGGGGGGDGDGDGGGDDPSSSSSSHQQNHHLQHLPILAAQRLATGAFGSRATFFLVNGTSGGLHAAVATCCADGDVLVAPRSCHQSAFFAAAVAGAAPAWLEPEVQRVGRRGWESVAHGVTAEQVARAIDEAQQGEAEDDVGGGTAPAAGQPPPAPQLRAKEQRRQRRRVGAVLITSPTYFGAVAPVREIARECHARGVPLIVDEAHGAHLAPLRRAVEEWAAEERGPAVAAAAAALGTQGTPPLLASRVPEPALAQGADISVQSAHKTLTALTQAALLHVGHGGGGGWGGGAADGGRAETAAPPRRRRRRPPPLVPAWRVARCLQALQTSSPSYLLTSSLDAARALAFGQMGEGGGWVAALRGADALREGLRRRVPRARLLEDMYCVGGEDGGLSDGAPGSNSGSSSSRNGGSSSVAGWDPLRVAVDVSRLGAGFLSTGAGAAAWLERERGVVVELSVGPLVVMVWGGNQGREGPGVGSGGGGSDRGPLQSGHESDAERVVAAFEALAERAEQEEEGEEDERGQRGEQGEEDGEDEDEDEDSISPKQQQQQPLSPREALFGAARWPPPRRVPLDAAARDGLVSAELLCPYPPGVPEVLPGERLTRGAARRLRAALRSGATVAGASDAALATVLVFC